MHVKRSVVLDAYREIRSFSDDEQCEHDVNICWCHTFRLLDDLEEALELPEDERAPQTARIRWDKSLLGFPEDIEAGLRKMTDAEVGELLRNPGPWIETPATIDQSSHIKGE
jgi:hypothetical protein